MYSQYFIAVLWQAETLSSVTIATLLIKKDSNFINTFASKCSKLWINKTV